MTKGFIKGNTVKKNNDEGRGRGSEIAEIIMTLFWYSPLLIVKITKEEESDLCIYLVYFSRLRNEIELLCIYPLCLQNCFTSTTSGCPCEKIAFN